MCARMPLHGLHMCIACNQLRIFLLLFFFLDTVANESNYNKYRAYPNRISEITTTFRLAVSR